MINLDNIPKVGLYAFWDSEQYSGTEFWYDSFNHIPATVYDGGIAQDNSVFFKPAEKYSDDNSYMTISKIIPKGGIENQGFSIYVLMKIEDSGFLKDRVEYIRSNYSDFGFYSLKNTKNKINAMLSGSTEKSTNFDFGRYYLFSIVRSYHYNKIMLNKEDLTLSPYNRTSYTSNNIYIGNFQQSKNGGQNIYVKSVALFNEVHNEYQTQKVFNFFSDTYNIPELYEKEKLIAKIPRLDGIAITAAMETNYSKHKGFKQIINSYRKGVSS